MRLGIAFVVVAGICGCMIDCKSSKVCKNPGNSEDPCAAVREWCGAMDTNLFNPATFYFCSLRPVLENYFGNGNHTMQAITGHAGKISEDSMKFESNQMPIFNGGLVPFVVFFFIMLPLMIMYYYVLFVAANDYLTPSLGLISSGIGLSPAIACVTILEFGNSAPDFFTSLAGVEELENVQLIVSGAIGSGLFISIFIFGIIIVTASRGKDGNTLVDVEDGMKSIPNDDSARKRFSKVAALRSRSLADKDFEKLLHRGDSTPNVNEDVPFSSRWSLIKNLSIYLFAVFLLLYVALVGRIHIFVPILGLLVYLGNILAIILIEKFWGRKDFSTVFSNVQSNLEEPVIEQPPNSQLYIECIRNRLYNLWKRANGALNILRILVCLPLKVILALSIPPLFISNEDKLESFIDPSTGSVPSTESFQSIRASMYRPSDMDCLEKYPFMIDYMLLIANPFFSVALLMSVFSIWGFLDSHYIPSVLCYLVGSMLLSTLFWATAGPFKRPRYRLFLHCFAFVMSMIWIYGISKEVINLFLSISLLLPGISQSVIGITLFSWAHTFGDLIVDLSVTTSTDPAEMISKWGGFELALSGIFSGPVLNFLLVSLCSAFFKILIDAKSGGTLAESAAIHFDMPIYIGLFVLIFSLITSLVMIVCVWRFKMISKWYGYFLIALYIGVFLPSTLLYGQVEIK